MEKETLERFKEEVCSTCKGYCDRGDDYKGITFIYGSEGKEVRCVDYVKDEEKIVKPVKEEVVTARKRGSVMKELI